MQLKHSLVERLQSSVRLFKMHNSDKKNRKAILFFWTLVVLFLFLVLVFFWLNPKAQSPAEVITSPTLLQSSEVQSSEGVGVEFDARSCPSPKGIAVLSVDLWAKGLSKIPTRTLESLRKEVRQYNQEMLAQHEEQHGGRAEVNQDYCGVSHSFEEQSKKGFSQFTMIREIGTDFFSVDYFEVLKDHAPGIDAGEDATGVLLVNRSDFEAKTLQGNVEIVGDFLLNTRILSQTAHAANFLGIWLFDPKSLELIHQEDSPSASHWGTPEIKVISTSGRKIKLSYTYTEPSSHECSESGFAYTKTLRTIELGCPNMPRTKCSRTQSESEKQKACAHD
jgi:hypothetical protein